MTVPPGMGIRDADLITEETPAEEQVARVRAEAGDQEEVVVHLARRKERGRLAALGTMGAEEFSAESVAGRFGAGSYQVRVTVGGKQEWKGVMDVDPSLVPPPAPKAELHSTKEQPPATEPLTVVLLKELLTELREQRKTTTAPPAKTTKDFLEELALMKQIFAPPAAAPAPSLQDQLAVATQLANLGKTIVGGDGGDETAIHDGDSETLQMLKVAKELGAPILTILQDAIAEKRAQRVTTGAGTAPTPGPTTTADAPPSGAANMEPWLKELSGWMPQALKEAENNQPAESFVAYMVDRLSDITFQKLADFARQPNAPEQFITLAPPFAKHREWVVDFCTAVKEISEPEGETAP